MSNSDRPLPSLELSTKYMAWDIKKIGESVLYLKEIAEQLKILNGIIQKKNCACGSSNNGQSRQVVDTTPF